jgi:hypothetical protein
MCPAFPLHTTEEGTSSMDRKFLEFWGNFLLSAAKGQEQVENLNRLASEGVKTFEQQLALFQKFYGLDKKPDPSTPYAEMWTKAAADFMKSYQEFMGLMGMVSREDYEALSKENENLKRKVEDLEESLRRTKKRTAGKDTDPAEVVKGFEGLMKKQAEQFQALMESYGKMYEVKKPGKERRATHTTEASNKRG